MKNFIQIVVFIFVIISSINCDKSSDSYLSAYKNSHDVDTLQDTQDNRLVNRDDYLPPDQIIGDYHPAQYGPPGYESPKPEYGPPKPEYGPPKPEYGPPRPIYGPPTSYPVYPSYGGYAATQYGGYNNQPSYYNNNQQVYSAPRENWLDKLKFKFDLFTIGKILLKLIIFKKAIKFIALLCLLLFIPKLQVTDTSSDTNLADVHDDGRLFHTDYDLKARQIEASSFALTAIAAFKQKYPEECKGQFDISCKFGKMFDAVDKKFSYDKIVQMYLPDKMNPIDKPTSKHSLEGKNSV